MDVALVVDLSGARQQRIIAHMPHLARQAFARRRRDDRPVGHDGLAGRLPIDRPGRAVIVWPALPRLMLDVTDDAEAELGIFIENLPFGYVIAQISGDKRLVTADLADQIAHPFAPCRSGIRSKNAVTLRCELLDGIRHDRSPRGSRSLTAALLRAARTRSGVPRPGGRH